MPSACDVDRVLAEHGGSVLTAPDTFAWIEREALRRAAELAQVCEDVDADRTREHRVLREIERLTDVVARWAVECARETPRQSGSRAGRAKTRQDARCRAAIRAQMRALVTGLDVALRTDVARAERAARDARRCSG